ncbi:MAG: hypothetical protein NVSMB10_17240 [Steroidobacteraceae bacterium]
MIEKNMTTAQLELVYDLIANAVDEAGKDKAQLFLAKLAFGLASRLGDSAAVAEVVGAALRDL